MLFLAIILVVLLLVVLIRYEPKIDIIASKGSYLVLLWYNTYSEGYGRRIYIELFKI